MSRICMSLVLLGALVSVACSARLRTGVESPTPESGRMIAGIPFRIRDTFRVRVYQRQADGEYKEVWHTFRDLPDFDRVYVVGFDADAWSDHSLGVTMNEDGTLKKVTLETSEFHGDAAVAALSTQVKELSVALAGTDKAEADARKARLEAEEGLRLKERDATKGDLDRVSAAKAAAAAVETARLELAALAITATPLERHLAETKFALAQDEANTTAELAGLALPFPERRVR